MRWRVATSSSLMSLMKNSVKIAVRPVDAPHHRLFGVQCGQTQEYNGGEEQELVRNVYCSSNRCVVYTPTGGCWLDPGGERSCTHARADRDLSAYVGTLDALDQQKHCGRLPSKIY